MTGRERRWARSVAASLILIAVLYLAGAIDVLRTCAAATCLYGLAGMAWTWFAARGSISIPSPWGPWILEYVPPKAPPTEASSRNDP